MKHQIHFLLSHVMLLSFLNSAQAANITASVDRSQIFLDESFRVVFEADDSVDGNPDFSPLQQDFEILSQSQSTNMSYVNGQYSRKGVWSLDLMAKKSGALTIPSVSFGSDQSPALRIQIRDPATSKKTASTDKDVFVQVELDEDKAWVQSQVIYSVRLFSRISMNNLRSSEPKTSDPDAIIQQLGNATSYEAFRNGVRYAVHEIRYAVFPQHSGKLEFQPMIFEGLVSQGRGRSLFDQFLNQGERKRVRSGSTSIEVAARPANIKQSEWLPAKGLRISEEWSEDVRALKNGEPVTRTITIIADGNKAENLPELEMAEIEQLKQYPDKPLLDNKISEHGITATRQIKVALIPTRSGGFRMPEISLPWFNTETGQMEVARLPEKLIRARGEIAQTTPVTPESTATPKVAGNDEPINISTEIQQITDAGYWPWLSLLLGAGWLLTLIALLQRKPREVTTKIKQDRPSLRPLEKTVQQHCNNNDAHRTKDALLSWARACWPDQAISSLAAIADRASAELATEINALNTALYSADASQWQGDKLFTAFKQFKPKKVEQENMNSNALEPLYKT